MRPGSTKAAQLAEICKPKPPVAKHGKTKVDRAMGLKPEQQQQQQKERERKEAEKKQETKEVAWLALGSFVLLPLWSSRL